jgi:hypothetical protein
MTRPESLDPSQGQPGRATTLQAPNCHFEAAVRQLGDNVTRAERFMNGFTAVA